MALTRPYSVAASMLSLLPAAMASTVARLHPTASAISAAGRPLRLYSRTHSDAHDASTSCLDAGRLEALMAAILSLVDLRHLATGLPVRQCAVQIWRCTDLDTPMRSISRPLTPCAYSLSSILRTGAASTHFDGLPWASCALRLTLARS